MNINYQRWTVFKLLSLDHLPLFFTLDGKDNIISKLAFSYAEADKKGFKNNIVKRIS